MKSKITYLDNAGFMVEYPAVIMVFDYYRDPAHALEKTLRRHPDKPVVFFVSHSHPDHYNREIFDMAQNHRRTYVLSNDILPRKVNDSLPVEWMSAGDKIEDLPEGIVVQAYGSTDKGVSYFVTMPDGYTYFHAGDLNNWHWDEESTERDVRKAQEHFTVVLNRIAAEHPSANVAFFPTDTRQGANFASGASQMLNTIAVDNFFPMHFNGPYEVACDINAYDLTAQASKRTAFHCLHKPGDSVEL